MRQINWILIGFFSLGVGCNKNAVDAQRLAKQAQTIQGEDPKLAIEQYRGASQLDPKNHKILAALATLHEKNKDWASAAEIWASAAMADVPASDTFASYHFRRGYALYELARKENNNRSTYEKAIEPLKKAVSKDPNIADAYYYLGKIYYTIDDEQSALEFFTKSIETKANQLPYYVDLSKLYLDLGYFQQGLQVAIEANKQIESNAIKYKSEVERNDGFNDMYNISILEARGYDSLNKTKEKLSALEKARQIPNPKNIPREAEYHLALVYYESGKPQEACKSLTGYLKTPAGRASDSIENRKDAESKKVLWKCL